MAVTTRKRTETAKKQSQLPRQSTLSQWGNSLGVRIPQDAVEQLGLRAGEQVQVEVTDDAITIRPSRQRRRKWTVSELLRGVAPQKVGNEFPWGESVGKERL